MSESEAKPSESEAKPTENQFSIQKLYVKDISFESPGAPKVFSDKWAPEIELNLNNNSTKLNEGLYEVVLTVTATVSNEGKTAFLVEVHQAGIFQIEGFNNNDTKYILGSQCMNILFPFAREAVSDMSNRGGYPPLLLNPVNFDALYAQAVEQKKKAKEETKH